MTYADQKKKIDYYRTRIIQDLTKKGIYPDDQRIAAILSNINTSLGILQYVNIGKGEEFDTKKFNEDMLRIWQDLKILYTLAYDITVKDYEELKVWSEVKLEELKNMTDNYRYKTKFELDSTYLGTTIFFQSVGYDIKNENGVVKVNLGTVSAEAQAKLFCVFDCDAVNPRNVIFSFKNSKGLISNCSPYVYNRDFFTVEGTLRKNTYNVVLNGEKVRTSFICTPASLAGKVSHDNKYKLYGGKGFITKGYLAKKYAAVTLNVPIEIGGEGGIVTFFIVNGSYATFSFSEEPQHKNFNGTDIKNMPYCQKIVIEHYKDISFTFKTDGIIFATCHDGSIVNGELLYPAADPVNDIMIEEYTVGSKQSYDVTVTAGPFNDGRIPDIKIIAIKQVSMLEAI